MVMPLKSEATSTSFRGTNLEGNGSTCGTSRITSRITSLGTSFTMTRLLRERSIQSPMVLLNLDASGVKGTTRSAQKQRNRMARLNQPNQFLPGCVCQRGG